MENTYRLRYSKRLIMKAVRTYFLRKLGPSYFIAFLLLLGFFVYELSDGNRSWYVGLMGSIIAFGVLVPLSGIVSHTRTGLRKLAELENTTATMRVTENGIVIKSALGSSELHWKTITQIWRYPVFWILLSGDQMLMTLPLTDIDAQGIASIQAAFEKANVRIA